MSDEPPILPLTTSDGDKTTGGIGLSFPCQVEHPVASGIAASKAPGEVIVSAVLSPNGGKLLVQVRHEDGSALAFFLGPRELDAFHIALDAGQRTFVAVEQAAQEPIRQ